MSRPQSFLLAGLLALFLGLYGGLTWLADGLYLDTHEGDSYHLLDILIRMSDGAVPHLDFVTPLGALAFWPIHWFMEAGFSAGRAMILAQLAVALGLFPIVLYAAISRLTFGLAVFFGCVTLGHIVALSYGTPNSGVGISMHYNRWAWSVAFTMLLLVLVPGRGRAVPLVDGALVGLLCAVLLLLKATYFVALLPVAALGLAGLHGVRGVAAAVVAGATVALVVTALHGFGFWLAYLADLRLVAGNQIRPFVGTTFDQILAGPAYIGATLVGILTALVIRATRPGAVGAAVLLMVPGFLYITYQNFGNDPQWLLFIPVLLLALRPEAGEAQLLRFDARPVAHVTAIAAFALIFPSLFNIALSPVKHASFDQARFLPMLPEEVGHQDVFIRKDRAYMMTAQVFRDQEPGPWSVYEAEVGRAPVTTFGGINFPHCEFMAGSRAMLETLGADLAAAGIPEGSRLFTADLLSAYRFFAPVDAPEGSAPWYYGGLTGLENTDYVMVPKCAFTTAVRNIVLAELEAAGVQMTLVRDNDLLALYHLTPE